MTVARDYADDVRDVVVDIYWPSYWSDGKRHPLLYLLDDPIWFSSNHNVTCYINNIGIINSLQLKVMRHLKDISTNVHESQANKHALANGGGGRPARLVSFGSDDEQTHKKVNLCK